MDLHRRTMMTRSVGEDAVASGTWAKVGRSHYRRVTGEEIRKTAQGWDTDDGYVYQSRGAAISATDYKHRPK